MSTCASHEHGMDFYVPRQDPQTTDLVKPLRVDNFINAVSIFDLQCRSLPLPLSLSVTESSLIAR